MYKSKVEDNYFSLNKTLRFGNKLLNLSYPQIMGIINVTHDSFYTESRNYNLEEVLFRSEKHLEEGADILDIGGYSTWLGCIDISVEEEIARVVPAITVIKAKFPEVIISIDTFRGSVAEAAIIAGANIINDISGANIDPSIIDVAAKYKVPYILMHMKGTPQNMQEFCEYEDIFSEVSLYFSDKIELLKSKGVNDIILDPGFGFSKNLEQNHELFSRFKDFKVFELPILIGISRKSMIYKKLNIKPQESLNGTTVLNTMALMNGANILRVHDVKEAKQIVELLYK